MNEMTATLPLQYVTYGDITYLLTPIKSLKQIELVKDFTNYLDKLDPEVFNRSNEEYGTHFDLKEFSDLITADYLNEEQLSVLNNNIIIYKEIVKEVIQNKIIELSELLSNEDEEIDEFTSLLEAAMNAVETCVEYAEENNLTNTQDFINWEDDLNAYSVKDHNC